MTRNAGGFIYWSFFLLALLAFSSCRSAKMLSDASSAKNKEFKGTITERYSALLGVRESEVKNTKLYRFIDDWMGVPHLSGGTTKGGADCSGFTSVLQKEIYGLSVPRTAKDMAEFVKRKFEGELKEGDLVFFDFNGRKFNHVGVYLQNSRFVHVSTSKGVIVSNLKDSWYYKYFSRCGTVVEDSRGTNASKSNYQAKP